MPIMIQHYIYTQVDKVEKDKYRQELLSYHGRADTFETEKYYKVRTSDRHPRLN
jgi:hypothetical protein